MEIDPWLARATARRPDAVALETPEERLTYRELLLAATRGAARLVGRGAAAGDRVALTLPPGRALVVALHACLLLRAPAVPVDPRLAARERKDLLREAEFVVNQPLAEDGGAPFSVGEPDEDEVALVVHTSGTTRRARAVELTFGNLAAHVRASGAALGMQPDERWLCPMPLSHVGGLMILVRSAAAAGTVVLEPPPFDADRVVAAAAARDVTLASLVPTMLQRVLDAGGRPGPRLRRVLLGGGPVSPALMRRAADAGFPVSQTYGLTEACSTVTLAEPGDLETAGRALPGTGLTVAADGEILISGPTVVGEWDALRTGDLGRLDDEGRLTVIGRKSDTIVTGGENVAPAEVEAVLEEHPGVAEAAVFARPHPEWGESVIALVVPEGESAPSAAALREHVRRAARGLQGPEVVRARHAAPADALWQAAAPGADVNDADDYRKDSRARWGEQAKGWSARAEELARITMPVSVWMVDALELQAGHEVLELAAGTGEVGFLAAEQIAPGGTLISSDFVPEMITAAQARAERLGITNVRFRQIDAEGIDQPAATLDGVLCRWGYMLMADGEAALQETRRVLKPGARVALAAWTGPGENPWASIPGSELVERGHLERPDPDEPGQFAWARRGHDRGAPRHGRLRRARGRHRRLRHAVPVGRGVDRHPARSRVALPRRARRARRGRARGRVREHPRARAPVRAAGRLGRPARAHLGRGRYRLGRLDVVVEVEDVVRVVGGLERPQAGELLGPVRARHP